MLLPITQPTPIDFSDDTTKKIFQITSVCVIGPFIETVILVLPTTIISRIFPHKLIIAAFLGSLLVTGLHWHLGWTKILIVCWGFFWSSYWYLMIKDNREFTKHPFLQVFGLHSLGNTITTLFILID